MSTCEDISDDNEVYFPKAQKTPQIIWNMFFVYFFTCTYSQGLWVQILTKQTEGKTQFEQRREDKWAWK